MSEVSRSPVWYPPAFPLQGRLPHTSGQVQQNIQRQCHLERDYQDALCLGAGYRVTPPCCRTLHISFFFDGTGNNLNNDWFSNPSMPDGLRITTNCRKFPMIWLERGLRRAATTSKQRRGVLVRVVSIIGFSILANSAKGSAIEGVNHTAKTISQFSVNGRSGLDSIGPYQSGGGGCCYITPSLWQPGMEVRVNWQTSPGAGSDLSREFPGFADEAKYDEWLDKLEAQERKHTKTVPIPDYTHQKTCGITVHFLPCDELQVTTSCYAYGNPEYPIKSPLKLPEPQSCPT